MSILSTNSIQSLSGQKLLGTTGGILQVQQAFKGDTFTSTATLASGGAAITGLSVTITPTSATNKILLFASIYGNGQASVTQIYTWFVRNSTKVGAGTPASNRLGVAGRYYWNDGNVSGCWPMIYLDNPTTTSSITYYVYGGTEGSGTFYVGRTNSDTDNDGFGARGSSSLTAFEVVA